MAKTNVFYFGGGVGGALAGIHFLKAMERAIGVEQPLTLILAVPDRKGLYQDLFASYPEITIVECNRRTFLRVWWLYGGSFKTKNLVLVAQSFASTPRPLMIMAFLLTRLNRASRYVGFDQSSLGRVLQKVCVDFPLEQNVFTTLCNSVAAFDLPATTCVVSYRYQSAPELFVTHALTPHHYIVLHAFAASRLRQLPNYRYVTLLQHLGAQYPDYPIVLTGAKKDVMDARAILQEVGYTPKVVSLVGMASLQEVATLVDNAALFIGVDTGITHLAGVLKVPSVIIGNNSNPSWLPTYNPNAIIVVNKKRCTCDKKKGGDCFVEEGGQRYYRCMLDITDAQLATAITASLTNTAK